MRPDRLRKAIAEAERFLEVARRVSSKIEIHKADNGKTFEDIPYGYAVNASCKRASLDLSRALAELRKP